MTQLTDEQRAAYREAKREQAEHALETLLSEEGWATWLRLRRNLHDFSWTNQALIAAQAHEQATLAEQGIYSRDGWTPGAPDTPCAAIPTLVKSAGRWKRDGYHPAKGTRGLYVWVYKSRRRKDGTWFCCGEIQSKGTCPTCGKQDRYFQLGAEFDASQVISFETGEPPVVSVPESQPVTGSDPGERLLAPLAEWAVEAGVATSVDLDATSGHGEGGSYNTATGEIRVCTGREPNSRLRTLIHELAHAKGITSKSDTLDLSYSEAEVAVECVSYVVAATAGLDTSSEAIPYIAGWGGADAKDKVRALGQLIDTTAKELEQPILALLTPTPEEAIA